MVWCTCKSKIVAPGPGGKQGAKARSVPPLPQDKARALDNQQALDRESAYCHSFGSREMSELWLPQWHCPFLILAEGRPEAQSGFLDLGLWLAYGYK